MSEKKVNRRGYVKYAGAGVVIVAVAGAGAYYVTKPVPEPSPTPTPTVKPTPEPTPTPSPTPTPTPKYAKEIIIALGDEVSDIDPSKAHMATWSSHHACNAIYDQLTEYARNPMTGEPGFYVFGGMTEHDPMLAEKYEFTDGGASITYNLRKGIKWPDGTELTTDDVAFSLTRESEAPGSSFVFSTLGYEGVEVIDKYTIKVKFEKPSPFIQKSMGMTQAFAVMQKSLVEPNLTEDDPNADEWLMTNSASGIGPFLIEKWTPGVEFILKANEEYWKGKAPTERIILKYVPDVSSRIMMLQEGSIDITDNLMPYKEVKLVEDDPNIRIFKHPSMAWDPIYINHSKKPWQDKMLRKACAYAIPYETIIEKVFHGYAAPMKSCLSIGMEYRTEEFWEYKFDLDKAQEFMDQSDYAKGVDIDAYYVEGNETWRDMFTWIQPEWAKIGVNMTINPTPSAAYSEMRYEGELPLFIWHSMPFVQDPYYQFRWWYHSHEKHSYPLAVFYDNPRVDELVDENIHEMDDDKRRTAAMELQKIIMDDVVEFWICHPLNVYLCRKNVEGICYYSDEGLGRSFYYLTKEL